MFCFLFDQVCWVICANRKGVINGSTFEDHVRDALKLHKEGTNASDKLKGNLGEELKLYGP